MAAETRADSTMPATSTSSRSVASPMTTAKDENRRATSVSTTAAITASLPPGNVR